MNDRLDQLKGRAQIDFIRVLTVLVRKYGIDGVVEITREELTDSPRGGLRREIDEETGTLTYRFEHHQD